MNPKSTTGIFIFRNDQFPDWYVYSNDATGGNLPTIRNGKAVTWSQNQMVFNFTDEQEKEIDDKIANDGYCTFQSAAAVISSGFQNG
jgi:hypothetical protein